jgi:DNA polymerase-3 subunit alpha
VEPIHHGLIFERFLNPGRISMPDIDLDFRDDCRSEMLEYAARKFGDDRVAQIITFGTMGARAAIRDVGRVMDIPLSEVDRVAKVIPNIPGKPVTLRETLEEVPEFKQMYESQGYLKELIDTAADMEGVVRNAGTHAAGVVIADRPLVEYVPLHRPTGATAEASPIKIVTQFEMGVLESLGMLKVDFLGLSTLSIMARACDLIRQRHGIQLNLGNIPTDDPDTYAMLGRGETAGVFQVEGSGMRRWLMQMKPNVVENVIAMVALFRPGPMDFIPAYIRRMHGEEAIEYRHPMLERIFMETYGFPVYQEQLMNAAMQLAGYTPPESDDLRKAISKKIKDKLLKHKKKFVHGAVERGISEETAEAIFEDWEEFARYGFNKSHAADYGIIAVQTAYLKCHYPEEYMTALLSVWQNDNAKVAVYVADCRRMGINVQPPSVNISGWDFTIEDLSGGKVAIRFGLGAVKNVGHAPVDAILNARDDQPFIDINDFARRVDLRSVGKRPLECLIKVGALDEFGSRSAMLAVSDQILSISASHFRASDMGQISMFGMATGISDEIVLPNDIIETNRREVLEWERELIGLYVSDHPLSPVMDALTQVVTHFAGQLAEAAPGEKVRVAGMVTRVRPHLTKTGKNMGFVTLEDVQGNIELVVFPRTWEQYWQTLEVDSIVLVDGKVDAQSGDPKVLVDTVTTDLKSIISSPPPPVIPSSQSGPKPQANPTRQPDALNRRKTAEKPATKPAEEISEPPPPEPDWGDDPEPPSNFDSDWLAMELTPGGFIVERGVISSEAPIPAMEDPATEESTLTPELTAVGTETVGPGNENGEISLEPMPAEEQAAVKMNGTSMTGVTLEQERNSSSSVAEVPITPVETNVSVPPYLADPNPGGPAPIPGAEAPPAGTAPAEPPYILPPAEAYAGQELHMITVVLRQGLDKVRDNLRLRQCYGILISYSGHDRFALQIFERNRGYRIEFPNYTTTHCAELIARLSSIVGAGNVIVEPLRLH